MLNRTKSRPSTLTPLQRTQLAYKALGWQGGTIHQAVRFLGLKCASSFLYHMTDDEVRNVLEKHIINTKIIVVKRLAV